MAQYYVDEDFRPKVLWFATLLVNHHKSRKPSYLGTAKVSGCWKGYESPTPCFVVQRKSFTQYEMVWMGHHKLLVDTTNSVCELVETITKELDLQPTFTFDSLAPTHHPLRKCRKKPMTTCSNCVVRE